MEISTRTWLIIIGALVVGYFLLKGKGDSSAASYGATGVSLGGGSQYAGLASASDLAKSQLSYDLSIKTLDAQTEVAKAQIAASASASASQQANAYNIAVLAAQTQSGQTAAQATTSQAQIAAAAAAQAAQAKAYEDAVKAQQTTAIITTLGGLAGNIFSNWDFGSGWGGFGGFGGGFGGGF